jgi:ferric-dicitrate binding protein FerR (iron transport regulator)
MAVLEPVLVTGGGDDDLEAQHIEALAQFREEAERLGRAQARLSRGLTQAAAKQAARIIASDAPLSPRDVASLATTAAALASSGLATWGKSIGVDVLLSQMQAAVESRTIELLD